MEVQKANMDENSGRKEDSRKMIDLVLRIPNVIMGKIYNDIYCLAFQFLKNDFYDWFLYPNNMYI